MCLDYTVNTVSILPLIGRLPMNLGLLVLLTGCTEGKSYHQTQMASLGNHTKLSVLIDMERYSPMLQLKSTLPRRTRTPKVSTPESRMASYRSSSSTRTQIPQSRSILRMSRLTLTLFVISVVRQASPSGRYDSFYSAYVKHRVILTHRAFRPLFLLKLTLTSSFLLTRLCSFSNSKMISDFGFWVREGFI
jgi:hypothetical protein